ncbi:DNA glycosylase [Aspergillus unguis]
MATLRRSSRLGAALLQPPTIQTAAHSSTSNRITKPRKPSTKEKKKKEQTIQNLKSHAQPVIENGGSNTAAIKANNDPTTTAPPLNPSTNYWEPSGPDSSSSSTRPQTPPPLNRPVEPHRTNATLLTPHGSSLVAYPNDISPSKTGLPRPIATTGTLLEKATAHLIATDARLEPLIKAHPCKLFSPEGLAQKIDPFRSLVGTIIGQQVSGAAARSIREKFVALLWGLSRSTNNATNGSVTGPDGKVEEEDERIGYFPAPEEIARVDIPTLRTAGLSQRKAEYIQGLAEKFASGELSARMLLEASDEDLLEKLTAVRGLGRWSVEMFACFTLKRTDVFSTGDLGVQRGCAAFIGKDVTKLKAKGGGKFKYMSESDMLELAAKFAPYRSLFMWYMWRVEDVDVTVMSG